MSVRSSIERSFVIEDETQRARLGLFLQARPLPFQVEVGPVREQRTLPQNARLWKLHQLASQVTGYSPDEMHEYSLMRHFGSVEKELNGIKRSVPIKRSSAREKAEFSEFMEATEHWYASDFGVWLGEMAA